MINIADLGDNNPLKKCKIYTIYGIDMIHIAEFADITQRSIQSTRHLVEEGNVIRKMKFFRDRSRIMIPIAELYGYPLVKAGHSDYERAIYHYKEVEHEDGTCTFERTLCLECSFGNKCAERMAAEDLVVPKGDD